MTTCSFLLLQHIWYEQLIEAILMINDFLRDHDHGDYLENILIDEINILNFIHVMDKPNNRPCINLYNFI